MTILDAADEACSQKFDAIAADQSCFTLLVVVDPNAGGFADRANAVAQGKQGFVVVWDKGCAGLAARAGQWLAGHDGSVAVVLDFGSGANNTRNPVAWLDNDADELDILNAFAKGLPQQEP